MNTNQMVRFDGLLYEDLTKRLTVLGGQFGAAQRPSKNPKVNLLVREARIYSFLAAHHAFSDFLRSMYAQSDFGNKEKTDPRNILGEVVTWLFRHKIITHEQAQSIVEQFESATILSYDVTWFKEKEERQLFSDRYAKLSRYYTTMSTVMSELSKGMTFTKGAANVEA